MELLKRVLHANRRRSLFPDPLSHIGVFVYSVFETVQMIALPLKFDFEAVYCFICGRRRMVVARYRMICLVSNPLSTLLTKLLTHIKQGLQKYCKTAYSRSGVNQMWILKNSKEIIRSSEISKFYLITNIKFLIFRTFTQPFLTRNLKAG